jgi:hypothetical protein
VEEKAMDAEHEGKTTRVPVEIYVTEHSEYHCIAGVCTGVRDLRAGLWVHDHEAVGMKVTAGFDSDPTGGRRLVILTPSVGLPLVFYGSFAPSARRHVAPNRWVITTSQVRCIRRQGVESLN